MLVIKWRQNILRIKLFCQCNQIKNEIEKCILINFGDIP